MARAWLAGALVSAFVVAGLTVVSATPAGAAAGNTTVTCDRDDLPLPFGPVIGCSVNDPDGLRTVRFKNTNTGATLNFPSLGCDVPSRATTFSVHDLRAARYKIIVLDCDQPKNRTTYVVRPNGSVRETSDS